MRDLNNATESGKVYNYIAVQPLARMAYTLWDCDSLSKPEAKALTESEDYYQLGMYFVNVYQVINLENGKVIFNDGGTLKLNRQELIELDEFIRDYKDIKLDGDYYKNRTS